jgi:hypothetical protein
MTITEMTALKENLEREARKWNGYLQTIPEENRAEREKELTRLLLETWLKGHQWDGSKGMPR